ncbi:MAG: methyltransferase [Mycobacterium sp.]
MADVAAIHDNPRRRLMQLLSAACVPHLVGLAANLRIADTVGDEVKSADEVALSSGIDPALMRRLLRALADLGLVTRAGPDRYGLGEIGQLLRSDAAGSMRDFALLGTHPTALLPWGSLEYSMRTGRPSFAEVFGASVFEYFAANADLTALYNAAMGSLTESLASAVATGYDFGRFGQVVDVGGGDGTLLTEVLRAWPEVLGVLFDTEAGSSVAADHFASVGLSERSDVVVGDFFESIPCGADLYLMKWILHDWDDESAVTILRNIRKAMPAHARLLVVEQVLPDAESVVEIHDPTFSDLSMLVLYGGKERTRSEFEELCVKAGLALADVVLLGTDLDMCLIEIVPV